MAVKEAAIEAALYRRVEQLGGICVKMTVLGRRGFVDRLVIMPGGRIIFVELKRPSGGRLSMHQIQWHKQLTALGVAVAVVRNVEDIEECLK